MGSSSSSAGYARGFTIEPTQPPEHAQPQEPTSSHDTEIIGSGATEIVESEASKQDPDRVMTPERVLEFEVQIMF